LKAVIWLALKTLAGTYQNVLKRSQGYEDVSAIWPTGNECRVIDEWPAVGYSP